MQVALNQFIVRVKSIERTLELRDYLESFGQGSPRNLNPEARAFRRYVRQLGLSGLQPTLDGSVLLLAAAFEQFVTNLIIAFAADLPNQVQTYSRLPNAIRSANERLTGEALDTSRSRFTPFDRQRIVDNLRDCYAGSIPYALNGEAMALNNRNLDSRRLRALISRLGVDNIWEMIGTNRTLQRWSGAGGAKAAKPRAQNLLNNFIDDRNRIAHRVGSATPGPDVIRSYIVFERALARSLVKELSSYAKTL